MLLQAASTDNLYACDAVDYSAFGFFRLHRSLFVFVANEQSELGFNVASDMTLVVDFHLVCLTGKMCCASKMQNKIPPLSLSALTLVVDRDEFFCC